MEVLIYTLLGVPVVGTLGELSDVVEFEGCDVCGQRPLPEATFLEYEFDIWSGEDLVTAMGTYAASDRLRAAIEGSRLTGIEFQEMMVSLGSSFEVLPPAAPGDFPAFSRLVVTGRAEGPEIWWTSEFCEACERRIWRETSEGRKAAFADLSGNIGIPREVYEDSWDGDDVFTLEDPGPPIVTQRFVDVLDDVGVAGVTLHPARWA